MSSDISHRDLVDLTRQYYDSADADNFYFQIWGGEDIHIGVYQTGERDIARASRRTVTLMAQKLPHLGPGLRVLDLGAGYGGAARHLAGASGCRVTALNLSATENARTLRANQAAGLDHLIDILQGSYEEIPVPDQSFDVVWSQDAILHSSRKQQVISEAARVLKRGGHFIFTDPMESERASREALGPVLDRIYLSEMGSFRWYRQAAEHAGFELIETADLSPNLPWHYACVRDELLEHRSRLAGSISETFIDRMLVGLDHWVRAGDRGDLAWGILHFRKR